MSKVARDTVFDAPVCAIDDNRARNSAGLGQHYVIRCGRSKNGDGMTLEVHHLFAVIENDGPRDA